MAYATPANMKDRFDVNRLGELVRDDGTVATTTQLDTDTKLAAILDDASGMVDSAVQQGKRYLPADLAALAGTALAVLTRLTCNLAYGLLLERRGYPADQIATLAPGYNRALVMLQQLQDGMEVFIVDAALNAGSDVVVTNQELAGTITLTSIEAERYFGVSVTTRTSSFDE